MKDLFKPKHTMTNLYKLLKRQNITFSLFVILNLLEKNGSRTIDQIAKAMGTSRTPVHNKLHRLRLLNLIKTSKSKKLSDSRKVRVSLSENGLILVGRSKEILEIINQ